MKEGTHIRKLYDVSNDPILNDKLNKMREQLRNYGEEQKIVWD